MYTPLKKFNVTLVLMVLLVLSLVQVAPVFSAESTTQQKALAFMEDVIKLDIDKYNVTLIVHNVDYPADLSSLGLDREDLTYALESEESKLNVGFIFTNGILTWCKLYVLNGVPMYTQKPSENVIDAAKVLLEQYQTKKDKTYVQQMRDMLDSIDEPKNMETISDNIRFTATIEECQTRLGWSYTSDGIDFLSKRVSIRFDDGTFVLFKDNWGIYDVGTTSVKISEEEAINVAREQAENYKLEVYKDEENHLEIDFNLSDKHVNVELLTLTRDSSLLYPFWDIVVYFDRVYNTYYAIQVGIWADTGEVVYCNALSGLGGTLLDNSTVQTINATTSELETSPSASAPAPQSNTSSIGTTIITIASTIVIAIAIATVAIKKKNK